MVKISQLVPASNEHERKEQVSLKVNNLCFGNEIYILKYILIPCYGKLTIYIHLLHLDILYSHRYFEMV